MSASASDFRVTDQEQHRSAETSRDRLVRAARQLPESDLRTVILATLADREPTPREALAWAALLQLQRRRTP
jgi:hypothetical protein